MHKIKLINSVENIHHSVTSDLICFLIIDLLNCDYVGITRMVSNLVCRKIELLLTLTMEEVYSQLSKEKLMEIMEFVVKKKLAKK